jgi:membrane-associated phospholipid phosphatase
VDRPGLRALVPHAVVTLLCFADSIVTDFRAEYVVVTVFWAVLTVAGPRARRFLTLSLPVLAIGILYDQVMPALARYRQAVHVADLYNAEKLLFGFATDRGIEIPAEWLDRHPSPILDIPCGLAYFGFVYQSFAVAIWLYFVDEEQTARFTWAWMVCNCIGMACELLFPTAPPWYVAQYGLGPARLDAVASAAGAARFDALLGIHYFAGFYARSKDVFGAMPSLHVAYPVVALLAVWNVRPRGVRIFCAAFVALMAFAAVYLNHHYVLDVIAGVVTGIVAYGVVLGLRRNKRERGTRDVQSP